MATTSTSASSAPAGDVVKLLGLAAVLGVSVSTVPDTFTAIAAIAAGLAGMLWIYRQILRPMAAAAARTFRAVGALEDLPEFMRETRVRLEQGSENFRQMDQRLSLAERAAQSVAGDMAATAERTAALARELDVSVRSGPSDT